MRAQRQAVDKSNKGIFAMNCKSAKTLPPYPQHRCPLSPTVNLASEAEAPSVALENDHDDRIDRGRQ
jgi:hypothetical protein